MKREDVLLATLAAADSGKAFEPVHVQKALFLIDRKSKGLFSSKSKYDFCPYDFGPFDSGVYHDLDALSARGLISIDRNPDHGYRRYSATEDGRRAGEATLASMNPDQRRVVNETVKFVLPLSFRALVTAIYREYPEMKENSVFR